MNNWTEWDEQVFQMIGRGRSRAGSSLPEAEARVWEMDSNGVLVSKPLKKVEEISETKATSEPQVLDLTRSKAASVTSNVNKLKVIADFIMSDGRI